MGNIERIKRVVALIEEDEREHDGEHFRMENWVDPPDDEDTPAFCNTTMCFAGFACVAKMGSMERFLEKAVTLVEVVDWDRKLTGTKIWEPTPWAENHLRNEAAEWLGLDYGQEYELFFCTWVTSAWELKERITSVIGVTIWPEIPYPPWPEIPYPPLQNLGED